MSNPRFAFSIVCMYFFVEAVPLFDVFCMLQSDAVLRGLYSEYVLETDVHMHECFLFFVRADQHRTTER